MAVSLETGLVIVQVLRIVNEMMHDYIRGDLTDDDMKAYKAQLVSKLDLAESRWAASKKKGESA